MNTYELLDKVLYKVQDMNIYFFYNEEDVEKTIGGRLLCGNVLENREYLVTSEPLEDCTCDFIFGFYNEYNFGYLVEVKD